MSHLHFPRTSQFTHFVVVGSDENPKDVESPRYASYELLLEIVKSGSLAEYFALGGKKGVVRRAVERGMIALVA